MPRKTNDTVKTFYEFSQRTRIPAAMLKAIPYIGDSLHELIHGGDLEKLLIEISKETNKKQDEIIQELHKLMSSLNTIAPKNTGIVAIGSGNMEYLYTLDAEILMGQKNPVANAIEKIGGGGLNFTSRLLSFGHQTFPILTVGDDHSGHIIHQELIKMARKTGQPKILKDFISNKEFLAPGIKTGTATIIIQGPKRTILSFASSGNIESFSNYVERRLDDIEKLLVSKPNLIRISHLQNYDGKESSNEVIRSVINSYSSKSIIYFNPGISQIKSGIKYWENILKKCDLVQFNLSEAKRLFGNDQLSTSLPNIMQWFMERQITIIVTMAKFGAVGIYRNGKDGIVFAMPTEVDDSEIRDPTGAGDAYSAGVVSELYANPNFSFQDFHRAIDTGRFWSTYACLDYGGSGNCPDKKTLSDFHNQLVTRSYNPIQVEHRNQAETYLRLIDKAYD